MLDTSRIRAISLDLDDTLWPIWPCIERAEQRLHAWLQDHAPLTARLFATAQALREIREHMNHHRPDLKHDLSALRRESIRLALERAGEDTTLADPAFEVFFDARQDVTPYDDVLPALDALAVRFPLVSLSNGNADLARVGMARYFRGAVSAREFGVAKPDPRIFHAAAQLAGVRPEEVLHVGDDVLLDVIGAQGAGMQAAWVNRGEALWPHEDRGPEIECFSLEELRSLLLDRPR